MAVVSLRIDEPANGHSYAGSGSVRFRGALTTAAPTPLFYRWYSNLDPSGSPISDGVANALDFTHALAVGTHVITFSATDVAGTDVASLRQVKHGGMAGGPTGPAPCIIDVLIAEIIAPAAGANLARASVPLVARAPQQWGPPAPNRVQYRWSFAPLGAPAGRPSADFVPPSLAYDPANAAFPGKPPTLTYSGGAPGPLALGAYQITLHVETNAAHHEATQNVTFTA